MNEPLDILLIKGLVKKDLSSFIPSLVSLFLKQNNLKSQNILLSTEIKKSDINSEKIIETYLNENKIKLDLLLIEKLFENSLNRNFRKSNGVFYTPILIVQYIIDEFNFDETSKVCDLSCGCGIFLIETLKKIHKKNKKNMIDIIEKNIYGYDISDESLLNTKILLILVALVEGFDKEKIKFNLYQKNSLELIDSKLKFTHIIGNPPYVRSKHIEPSSRNLIKEKFPLSNVGNNDLYLTFLELSFNLLEKEGKIGYIIPNSYFNTIYGRNIREFLFKNKFIDKIVDFKSHQIFKDCLTYTCISIFSNKPNAEVNYVLLNHTDELKKITKSSFSKIKYIDLNKDKFRFFEKKQLNNIFKIENSGKLLSEFNISTGIATLKNNLYLLSEKEKKGDFYIKNFAGKEYLIESKITKEVIKINRINSDADIKNNILRIIYPYKYDSNNVVSLNEIELKTNYPQCYKYLLSIKKELMKRDKGKITKRNWFEYGRTQNLKLSTSTKILVPSIAKKPKFIFCNKKDILFCEGYTLEPNNYNKELLLKVLNSNIMDYYIKQTSRVYSCDYFGYSKSFIKNFSIPNLSKKEIDFLRKTSDSKEIDDFLFRIYSLIH